ncbi:hypothetical protein R3W88_016697 [Solanum pinnatisectum]|uniref:RNase H type-1 domain-containing protein n=1 Tax=Solanum pinnatisectum TaxID=50273 RepID=A0AAV9KYB5_9SOLN|nr:hypothetical protein R3W88_016697 [Solanum pinnatisectum]
MLCIDHNLTPLEINTDIADIIIMISHGPLLYNSLIIECRYLMQRLNSPVLAHVFREQNKVADTL